jgi:predicted dienelactone hydrolase
LAINAKKFARLIPDAKLTVLPGDAQHYDFLDVCTSNGKDRLPARLCFDAPGVNRTAVHRETSRLAVSFFGRYLRPSGPQPAHVTRHP